jgi:hypothetical protein
VIQVGPFTPTEATRYLATRLTSHSRREPAEELAGLAQDLGNLPLALAQAAAYLLDLGLEVAGYRRRLADRRRSLAELVPDESGLPDDQHASLAATWSLSIERADRLHPVGLARPMLELASMLDPNGMPSAVLTAPPALAYLVTYRIPPTSTKGSTCERGLGQSRGRRRRGASTHPPPRRARRPERTRWSGRPHSVAGVRLARSLIRLATSLIPDRSG